MENFIYFTVAFITIFTLTISFIMAARQLSYAVPIANKQQWKSTPYTIPAARLPCMAVLTIISIIAALDSTSVSAMLVLCICLLSALITAVLSLQDTHMLVAEAYNCYIDYIFNTAAGPMCDIPPSPDQMDLLLFNLEPDYDNYFQIAYPALYEKWR